MTAYQRKNKLISRVLQLAVKLSRNGKREEIKQLIEKYGVKNITAVAESDLDSFYADLQQMEVS